ncbi:hypothetical protein GCM10007422_17720 [Pedobacter zeae]|uniref:Uncharacterized protein n=1 Tax=Pedobacter zeae TaxID=1737356 RepID=A0A7W6K9K6_9SPHI|nr:hypothetical protein [Pedobacter zeae]GGH02963.1 hypothetical protein GCM10007422_17720 [Pedobacter zeae]
MSENQLDIFKKVDYYINGRPMNYEEQRAIRFNQAKKYQKKLTRKLRNHENNRHINQTLF